VFVANIIIEYGDEQHSTVALHSTGIAFFFTCIGLTSSVTFFLQDLEKPANSKNSPNDVVFSALVPHNRKYSMTRWFQYMLSLAHFSIPFYVKNPVGNYIFYVLLS